MVVEYGPNKGIVRERERFWNDMDRTTDSVGISIDYTYWET